MDYLVTAYFGAPRKENELSSGYTLPAFVLNPSQRRIQRLRPTQIADSKEQFRHQAMKACLSARSSCLPISIANFRSQTDAGSWRARRG